MLEVKPLLNLVGTSVSYAYAVKPGPWIFLTDHEAYDWHTGRIDVSIRHSGDDAHTAMRNSASRRRRGGGNSTRQAARYSRSGSCCGRTSQALRRSATPGNSPDKLARDCRSIMNEPVVSTDLCDPARRSNTPG